jgi:saxitoxin biosynthesis operon SxtJ-like protein
LIEIEPFTVRQARKSTLVVAVVLALISAWQLYRGRPTASTVLAVIVGVLLVCAAIPALAVRFHKYWMTLAGVLGYINSRIILGVLFYLLMTPVGLVLRATGHDPLGRRKGKEPSYWRKRDATRQSREGYQRAF